MLHFTLVSLDSEAEELVADPTSVDTGAALAESLTEHYGKGPFTVAGRELAELVPGQSPLVNGAVVVRGETRPRASHPPSLVFAVNTGPDAGQVFPLLRGTYEVGRAGCAISINDPELSRRHAVLTVSDHHISLQDQDSANGTWVNGRRIDRQEVDAGSMIRLGSSRCSLVPAASWERARLGADVKVPLVVDSPPPPEKNRMVWVTALLPLVLGVVLAMTTKMWFFLAFSGLSAVTGLVPLLSGRRKRRLFTAAVESASTADEQRRRRAAPDPADLQLALRHGPLEVPDTAPPLRIGLADQPANVVVRPAQQGWTPPLLPRVPAMIEFSGSTTIEIKGASEATGALVRSLVLQLAAFGIGVISYGHSTDFPPGLRFLPGSTLVADSAELLEILAHHRANVVILWRNSAELRTALETSGKGVLYFHGEDVDAETVIDVSFHGGSFSSRNGAPVPFSPDLVSKETFEAAARAIASACPQGNVNDNDVVPETVRFDSVCPVTADGIHRAWSSGRPGLRAPVGSMGSTLEYDLVSQGPHLLVAGTTGAGKSELLRSLVLGIATHHSPSSVNFLFIDFKGGSGLGPLAQLPHSVGMLTDLSAENVARALISLKAEVRRREHLFAQYNLSDINDYVRQRREVDPVLPRLVIVVDEFRMLTEEVPTAVQDLMKIATLGRSLGVHLVMATQRPQGAITSDIRANVTASIALRVQSAADSQDVLDSPVAASIPVMLRGRAFIKVGSDAPVEFQTASTLGGADPVTALKPVIDFDTFIHAASALDDQAQPLTQLDAVLKAAMEAAAAFPEPWHPIQPALPATVPVPDAHDSLTFTGAEVPAGVLDIPEELTQRALEWNPDADSHLALLGISGSGAEEAMRALILGLARREPATHLYILDGESLAGSISDLSLVGAYVRGHEIKRAARVLSRVSGIISERLADTSSRRQVPLSVIVTGWGRWVSVFRSSRWAWAEDALGDIIRDGEKAGVTVLINGDRDLLAARFFSLLTNRVFLPTGSSSDSLMMWPKRPHMDAVPGRAYVQGRISTTTGSVAQMCSLDAASFTALIHSVTIAADVLPCRVEPLPNRVQASDLSATIRNGLTLRVPVGVGGDELETVRCTIAPRSVTAVLGAPGTGKSNLLELIRAGIPGEWTVLFRPGQDDPLQYWMDAVEATAKNATGTGIIALVDDADRLTPAVHQKLSQLHQSGAAVVFTAAPTPTLISKIPLAMEARSSGSGFVLGARQPSDADFFGVRLELEGRLPPGRAHHIAAGQAEEIQLALA